MSVLERYGTLFSYVLYLSIDEAHVRYYILTRFQLGFTAKQIHDELCAAWGHGYVSYSTVAKWLQRFRQRRSCLKAIPRIGRPVIAVTDENIDAVRMLIEENPYINIRYIACEVGVSYGTVNSIIHEELKMKKKKKKKIPLPFGYLAVWGAVQGQFR